MSNTTETDDWWEISLSQFKSNGGDDADKGCFNWPFADGDPEYDCYNTAYKEGFDERRWQLGDKFKWL